MRLRERGEGRERGREGERGEGGREREGEGREGGNVTNFHNPMFQASRSITTIWDIE